MADKKDAGPPHLEDPNSPDYVCVDCQSNVDALCFECQEMAQLTANSTRNDREGEDDKLSETICDDSDTTSLIQPMDQAVIACVKSFQKRRFYHKLFRHCENNPDQQSAFNLFLKSYLDTDTTE